MKTKNDQISSSILSNEINSFMEELGKMAKHYLLLGSTGDDSGDKNKNFEQFITTFSFKGDSYQQFIANCGLFATPNPEENYKFFEKAFPVIKATTTTRPVDSDGIVSLFATAMEGIDWKNPSTKAVILFITKVVISDFAAELFRNLDELPESSIKFFVDSIINSIEAADEINNLVIKTEIAKSFSAAIHYLSSRNPIHTFQLLVEYYRRCQSIEQKKIFFLLTSSLTTPEEIDATFTSIFSEFIGDFQSCDAGNQVIFKDFLLNLSLQTLVTDQVLVTNSVYRSLYNYVKNNATSSETLCALFAGLTNFFDIDSDLIPVENFYNQYISKHLTDISRVCYELTVKLRGANYQPEVMRLRFHDNFEWKPSLNDDEKFFQTIGQWIVANNSLFTSDTPYIDLFLEQLAFTDLKLFSEIIMPKFTDKSIFDKPNIPFFHAMCVIIPTFESHNPTFKYLLNVKRDMLTYVTKSMMELSLDPTLNMFMCNVASFTATLSQSGEDKENVLPRMLKTLHQTSFPLSNTLNNHSNTNHIIKELIQQIDKSSVPLYTEDNVDTASEDTFQSISEKIPLEEELLMISLYIEPDSELARYLCQMVFSQSSYTLALTNRVLQALVHRIPSFAEHAVRHLCNFFIDKKMSFNAIINVISTLMHVLEAANKENVAFSKDTLNSVNYVAIIGLCVPVRSLRAQIFKMCSIMSIQKKTLFYFQEFLNTYGDRISQRAITAAIKTVSNKSETELNGLPHVKFIDVANSNYSLLYVYYIASLGYYLAHESNQIHPDFTSSLLVMYRILTSILMQVNNKKNDVTYLANCTAMLVSIHDITGNLPSPMIYFDNHRIQSICHSMIEIIIQDKNPSLLNAVFSSLSCSLLAPVTPLLGQPIWELQHSLIMCLSDAFQRQNLNVLNDDGSVKVTIYTALHSALITIIRRGIISSTCDAKLKMELKTNDLVFLNNFGNALKYVFDKIFDYHKQNIKLGLLESMTFLKCACGHLFDGAKWFTFFFNISAIAMPSLIAAFSSWLRISKIPDNLYDAFIDKLSDFSKHDISIASYFFAHDPSKLIKMYMHEARFSFPIFAGMALQLEVPNDLISNLDQLNKNILESTGKPETEIFKLYYSNIGRMFALCFAYLTSQMTAERQSALNFIERLALVSAFIRKEAQSCVIVLKAIKDIRKRMMTSFSIFIQNDINQLSQLIATHFEFCNEQFIRESISIVLKPREASSSIHSRASFDRDSTSRSSERKSSTSNRRISKTSSMQRGISIFGSNMDEALKKLSSAGHQQLDYIDFNHEEVIISFIPRWLTSFHYDLETEEICSKCEPEFRAITKHRFIEALLIMCNRFGLIPAIAIIINGIIDRNIKYFIYTLCNLQQLNHQYKSSAMIFLIYIYNIKPDLFIENIMKYLMSSAWFFYKIQVQGKINSENFLNENPEEEIKATEADYASIISFILELIIECYSEDSEPLEKVKPHLIAFCDIILSTYSAEGDDNSMIDENLARLMDKIIFKLLDIYAEKAKTLQVIGPYIKRCPREFILEWGLCCGWLPAATRALQLFNYLHFQIESSEIPLLLRAIQCVSNILNERTDPSKISQFNKHWESQITMSKRQIDVKPAINYIVACLECLFGFVTNTRCYPTEIFSTAVALMKCCTPDQAAIYALSVRIVGIYIRQLKDPQVLKDAVGEGILPLFFLCSEASTVLLDEISTVIKTLIKANNFDILLKHEMSPIISMFVLIPSLWGAASDSVLISILSDVFNQRFGNDGKYIVQGVLSGRSRNLTNIKHFCQKYCPQMPKDFILQILHLYVQFARHGSHEQQEAVIVVTNEIKNFASMNEAQKDVAAIAEIAVKNQSSQNAEGVLAFIRELVKLNFQVQAGPPQIASKMVSQFPVVDVFSNDTILKWKPLAEDSFSETVNVPPLFVYDERFVGAVFLEKEFNVVKQVKEIHFTKLSEKYKIAFVQKPDTKEMGEIEIDNIIPFIKEMKKYESLTNIKVVKDASYWFKEQPLDTSVKANVFFPGHPDLQEICKFEMQGLEIPFKLH